MKKSLLSLMALVLWAGIFSIANAQSELDITELFPKGVPADSTVYTQLLNDYNSAWWYIDDSSYLNCDAAKEAITITSRAENDEFDTVKLYRLFLSPYRLSEIKAWNTDVDISNIKMIEWNREGNADYVKFNVGLNDVDANKTYYGFIAPIGDYDDVWTPSKEFCFQLNSNMCMLDAECDAIELVVNPAPAEVEEIDATAGNNEESEDCEGGHCAASSCVSMKYAKISHTIEGNNVVLTWIAVDGDTVDIGIRNPEDWIYEKLATVNMSDERYVYTMRWNGEQNFKFVTDCWEQPYKADGTIKDKTEKIVTPATGPAENVLYIAIAAIILYGAYTIFFRKSDNN